METRSLTPKLKLPTHPTLLPSWATQEGGLRAAE